MALLALKAARDLIVDQIRATWCPAAADSISIGPRRVECNTYPQAAIIMQPEFERDHLHGVAVIREEYRLFIEGRFAIPDDGTIDDLQIERANELAVRLVGEGSANPGSVDWGDADCYWPKLVNITLPPAETDDPFYSVVLVLELSSDVLKPNG